MRPFQNLHLIPSAAAMGVNSVQSFNVHSIVLQVPISDVTRNRKQPSDVLDPKSVIGVWASASRRKSRILDSNTGQTSGHGPYVQVTRLANPLFNQVIVPMARKDLWNSQEPYEDSRFAKYVNNPELGRLLRCSIPASSRTWLPTTRPRADLNAILLTGIPEGVVAGFQNYTGPVEADMLWLNLAVPPSDDPNNLGLVAGDAAGFPNGRRVNDDTTTVELRAIAGLTIPLVDDSYTPDAAASAVEDGTENTNTPTSEFFPYLGAPGSGYKTKPGTTSP